MKRAFLVEQSSGRRVAVKQTVVIGRTRECEFVIDDAGASRRHAEVSPRGDSYVWKDLGSTNGTSLNGRAMLAGELKDGDTIQIGDTLIRFVVESDTPAAPDEKSTAGGGALFRETIYDNQGQEQSALPASKAAELLETVYAVANELAANYDQASLTERVLALVMQAIGAQRGAIFLVDAQGQLDTSPVCVRHEGRAHAGAIHISQTVANKVLREGNSVLFQQDDTQSEIDASASIMALDLRSIVCVPLRAKDSILGILYIDTDRQGHEYTPEDVLLAAAVGNSAGLALDNARLYKEMLEKQRIEHDIETAWTIQEGFLVRDWPGEEERRFQAYGETRPARVVGGDFYDFVQPSADKVGILIGDVSGKGVPASLLMAQLLAEFRILVRLMDSPAAIVSRLNEELSKRSRRGMFCTLCYLSLDLTTGEVRCANAGHHAAVRIGKQGVSEFGEASGPPAGVVPVGDWEESRVTLAPGETVLLYTDGIVEAEGMGTLHEKPATDRAMCQYEFTNLSGVARAHHNVAPEVLLEAIFNDVLRFCAPDAPHDDCTMIAVRYLGHDA